VAPNGWIPTQPNPLPCLLTKGDKQFTLLSWPLSNPSYTLQGHVTVFLVTYDGNPANQRIRYVPEANSGGNLTMHWDAQTQSIILLGGKDWGKLSDYAKANTSYKRSNLPRYLWNYAVAIVDVPGQRSVYKTQPFRKLASRQWRYLEKKNVDNCIEVASFCSLNCYMRNAELTEDLSALLPFAPQYGSPVTPQPPVRAEAPSLDVEMACSAVIQQEASLSSGNALNSSDHDTTSHNDVEPMSDELSSTDSTSESSIAFSCSVRATPLPDAAPAVGSSDSASCSVSFEEELEFGNEEYAFLSL